MKFTIKSKLAAALALLSISTLSFGAACAVKSTEVTAPVNCVITKIDAPTDGSLPTAHTGTENLAYISKVFENQKEYHAYSYTLTNASITTQITRSFRDYKNGIMIASDITYSSVVKSGTQKCTVFNDEKGEYEVYSRNSGEPTSTTTAVNAEWSTEAPLHYTEYAYNRTYGLLQTELTGLILNEDAVIESGEVKTNPDGTYTQSFILDPVVSTYYYAFCMKTNGGLSGYPDFKSVSLSVTFTDKWLPLSVTVHDVSTVNKGVIVTSISDTVCEFTYGEIDAEHYAFYDSYFKAYIGDEDLEQGGDIEEQFVLDVTNVLSNGFANVLSGGEQFEIDLSLGENKYSGYLFVGTELENPLDALEIKLSLGKTLASQNFYVEYKNGTADAYYEADCALNFNLATLKPVVGEIVGWVEELAKAFTKISSQENETELPEDNGDALTELLKAMTLEVNGGEATLSLVSDNLLGLGVGVDVTLFFGVEDRSVTFRGGVVNQLSVNGTALNLGLVIRSTTAEVISRDKTDTMASLTDYVADVYSLISSDLIKVNAKLDGNGELVNVSSLKGLCADVTAYVDIDGVTVGAEAAVSYDTGYGSLSALLDIWYDYDIQSSGYGKAVLTLKRLNGSPVFVQVGCEVDELLQAIGTIFAYGGAEFNVSLESVINMVNSAFTCDFSSLLTEVYADNLQIKLGVNVDTVISMLGVKAGVAFGSCTLTYDRGDGVYGGELSARLPAIGFELSISGEGGKIEKPDTENCLDLVYVIEDIKSIANSELYEITIDFDGDKIEQVKGLTAQATVYADIKGLAVYAKVNASYSYNDIPVSATLSVWYEYDKDTDGKVVLSLDNINGKDTEVRVSARIDQTVEAVSQLLAYCNVSFDTPAVGVNIQLEEVLTSLLAADIADLIPELTTTTDGAKLSVNVDSVVKLFNVDLPVQVGNVHLAYSHKNCNLTASLPAFGLDLTVNGTAEKIEQVPQDNVLDLAQLIELVNGAIEQVNGIIENQAISFEIVKGSTYLWIDGITASVWGNGEVCWKAGNEYVALDLATSIAENGLDVTTFKLLYNKNANGEPVVRLAINEVGIDIYQSDIDEVSQGFASIYESIVSVIGGGKDSSSSSNAIGISLDLSSLTASDRLMTMLFGQLASGSWIDALNDLTLKVENQDGTRSLLLSYLADNAVKISVSDSGCISLSYLASIGESYELGGEVKACNASGSIVRSLNNQFALLNMASSDSDGSAKFTRLAYDFLFEAISSVSVKDILGSDTYSVLFELNGDNCNIQALSGVKVDAELYFTGASEDNGKLAEADLNIDANGTVIRLNVITERVGNQTYFYIDLRQAATVQLPDLKILATQSSLYDTIDILISTINDTNVLDIIGNLLPTPNTEKPDENGDNKIAQITADKICGVVEKILNFNLNDAIVASRIENVTTAVLDLDNVVYQLGMQSETLGTVEIKINHDYHSMKTSGKAYVKDEYGDLQLREWISLVSEKTAARDYSKFDKSEYISIEFLPTLIGDLVKFATDDDGKIYNSFTFSGSISAKIVSLFTVNIDNCAVTVGLDKEKGLTVSIVAHINRVSALGLVTIPESTFGITYRNNLITLAKGLNTAKPEYKIMTLDFLIDHMLTESGSVIEWMLDISGWKTMLGIIKSSAGDLNVSSGLTTTEDVYLYKEHTVTDDKEISMYDYVEAISVMLGGSEAVNVGNPSALQKALGIYDNYYAFSLNAAQISGGTLTELYAGLTRDDNGINGIKAYGAIQSYVTFSADLSYAEGCDNEYVIGSTLSGVVKACDLYENAKAIADGNNQIIDTEYFEKKPDAGYDEKFGCFTIAASGEEYSFTTEYSNVLYSHELTIIGLNGEIERRSVRHGSFVYLYDNNSPVYTDGGKHFRLLYSATAGEVGDTQVVMNGDLTVYAIKVQAVNVIVHNGEEHITVCSFTGDKVPTRIAGLQTISTPTYENGDVVGEDDIIPEGITSLDIYGTFVNTEITINFVKYTFSSQTMSYTASGRAAGFNDYYSVKGNTLVLENFIGGYPVTAIADGGFANTEGKPVSSVVVPENITYIGRLAFADNIDMQQAVLLANNVYFAGSDTANDFAFYGCNLSSNAEKTQLNIYYNSATCDSNDMTWTHFYTATVVGIKYYKYIGVDPNTSEWINYHENGGGALYSGGWYNVGFDVSVDLNGVSGSTLTQQAIAEILSSHFPVTIVGEFIGSAEDTQIRGALEAACTQFDIYKGGILYKCVFEVTCDKIGNAATAHYSLTYTAACTVSVVSPVEFTYYGVHVKANAVTQITIPVEGETFDMANPVLDTHDFTGWTEDTIDGEKVYTANWKAKEFNLKLRLTRGGTDTNLVYIDGVSHRINGGVSKGTTDVTDITIYGGEATFTVTDKVLTIVTGGVTYTIYVNEAKITGKDTGNKRNLHSDINGTLIISSDMTLTLSY